MRKLIQIILFFSLFNTLAQVDYSSNWEDFYSYNNVKDFIRVNNKIYALVDNAVFIYNTNSKEVEKLSSINGLSGETTSSIHYSQSTNRIIIGYETGMIEIIDEDNSITIAMDIVNFNFSGSKNINAITEYNNKLYLSTSFAIVEYDIINLQFGDTFFIANNSNEIIVNQVKVLNNVIYAATEDGIYAADVNNTSLVDYNNWIKYSLGNYTALEVFNNKIFTSKDKNLYLLEDGTISLVKSYSNNINSLKSSVDYLGVSTQQSANFLNNELDEYLTYTSVSTDEYYFNINTAFLEDDVLLIGTQEFGILNSTINNVNNFIEIHPDGPISNSAFSITAKGSQLWVVYGSYNSYYVPLEGEYGLSHYNVDTWNNKTYNEIGVKNLVHVTFDYENLNKVYISSWGASKPDDIPNTGGILVIQDDEIVDFWNYTNSGLEKIFLPMFPNYITTRINGTTFDASGNLWITNSGIDNNLKKYNGNWSNYNLNPIMINEANELNEIDIDKLSTKWIATRRNGVLVFNENGEKMLALTTDATKGSLPDLNTRAVKVDASNRVWIGTKGGLVVYYNGANIFNETIYDAEPIIILDNDTPKKLLGDQVINTIDIDGADNKWFGTSSSGVLQTNSNGTTVLKQFNTSNSPLPSNNIKKIAIDKSTGKVFFATANGIVAYNSNVATYNESLTEVYAYPNPSTKTNEFITIDGRNGEHLPKGTNVKILDSAGNLVYETNIKEGEELFGGKVVWDKRNLAGRKVASGVYIVLLTANDYSETTTTKIAIIN